MEEGDKRCVLVVDDNPYSRQLLKRLFESHGYRVGGTARSTKEATHLYEILKPDLVTLDLVMDHEHGFSTLIALRRLDHKARVIIVSSDSDPLSIEQAENMGAAGYVVKPVKWDLLKEAVERSEKA